jgi:flagellar hook-length control protein FliK
MNPFGGFMQAVSGLVPGLGDNTGKGVHGLPVSGGAILTAGDNSRSFLTWVQNFMDNTTGADAAGAGVFNFQHSDPDSDLPALHQLKAMMADAMDQSADQVVAHLPNDQRLDNGQVPLAQGIVNAVLARHGRRDSADTHAVEPLKTAPAGMVAKGNTPADGQIHVAGKDSHVQAAVSGSPTPAGLVDSGQVKENAPAFGQRQPAASSIPTQAGQADESRTKENAAALGQLKPAADGVLSQTGHPGDRRPIESLSEQVMKAYRTEEGVEKGEARSSHKPAAPAGDEAQTHSHRWIQERVPAGMGVAGKATDPGTLQRHPHAGQAKEQQSPAAGLTGQPSSFSKDDAADSRGKDPHHPEQRAELAEVKGEDWQKGQSSDSVKSAAYEQTRSQSSFQDAAKAMAGEPTTNAAVKSAAGHAAALSRAEDTAVKTFQTTVMDQIVDKASVRSIHGRSEIQIRLKPEFLGNVQMSVAADKEQLVVRIMTDRPAVKEIIETHLHHLKTELHSQGLTIDKFEVMVNPDANQQHSRDQFAQMFKHHFSQNSRQQPRGQDPETSNRDGGNNPDDDRPNRDGVNYFA